MNKKSKILLIVLAVLVVVCVGLVKILYFLHDDMTSGLSSTTAGEVILLLSVLFLLVGILVNSVVIVIIEIKIVRSNKKKFLICSTLVIKGISIFAIIWILDVVRAGRDTSNYYGFRIPSTAPSVWGIVSPLFFMYSVISFFCGTILILIVLRKRSSGIHDTIKKTLDTREF